MLWQNVEEQFENSKEDTRLEAKKDRYWRCIYSYGDAGVGLHILRRV